MAAKGATVSFGIVLVRIALGALLLHEAHQLWLRGVGPWIVEDTAFRVSLAPEWYRRFLDVTAFQAPAFTSWAIVIGAAAAGAALFVGAAVRPTSVAVVFLMSNAILAGPVAKREYAALAAAAALACFVSHAGLRMGLDAHLPRWLAWSGAPAPRAKPNSG
jgi:uncharacterized membrane protein YphA (DoxX/SURF4 family)